MLILLLLLLIPIGTQLDAHIGRAWNGMIFRYGIWKMPEWNGMEDFKNGMEDNLPYFHTNSILDFAHGIYRKIYTRITITKNIRKRIAANHQSTN